MRSIFVGVMALAMLAGCGDDVPAVQDPDRIVIRGKLLSQQEFLQTYCQNKSTNATCEKVSRSMLAQSESPGGVARN
jgi:hypothetical protein